MDHSHHDMNPGPSVGDDSVPMIKNMSDSLMEASGTNNYPGHQGYFYAGSRVYILFIEWNVTSWQILLASCFAVLGLAILYEGLKFLRELHSQNTNFDSKKGYRNMCSTAHILQSLLHIFQVALGHILMLMFMTFNVWLCLAVAVGAGIGYFLFGWKRRCITDESCA